MKIKDYTKEMVDEKSFIDMAYTLLNEKGDTMNLYDIMLVEPFFICCLIGDMIVVNLDNRLTPTLSSFNKERYNRL